MEDYIVAREHFGDKQYRVGDKRTARPNDVAHLVSRGVLVKSEPAPLNKAAYVMETKAAPLVDGQTGQDKPVQSSPAAPAPKGRASKKSKAAAKS
jgi:hypothetical protein